MESTSQFIAKLTGELQRGALNAQEAQQIAIWMLQELLKKSSSSIFSKKELLLCPDQKERLEQWIADITLHHKPLAYIFGHIPFLGHQIMIAPPVLIPRPETEEWVERLITLLKPHAAHPLKILDLCTGSGAIGISLALAYKNFHIIASDIAEHAVKIAQINATNLKASNVTVVKSDLFNSLASYAPFDIIVANPPYIDPALEPGLEPSVRNWEDPQALYAADHGYSILEKIIRNAPYYFSDRSILSDANVPRLTLEIGYDQGTRVAQQLKAHGFCDVMVIPDYAQKDRVVCGKI